MGAINENIFEIIDTKEKAYWLGLFYSDGNVSKTQGRVGFHISYKDKVLLEKLCDFIGDDRKNIKSYDDNKSLFYYIYSKKMKQDLINNGVVINKTQEKIFPKIENEELFMAFFTGVYDGDGAQKESSISSGNYEFLEYCCGRFGIDISKIKLYKNHWGSCYSVNIGVGIYEKLMNNYDDSLERKRYTSKYFPSKDYKNTIFDTQKIECFLLQNMNIDIMAQNLNVPVKFLQHHISTEINNSGSKFNIMRNEKDLICSCCGVSIGKGSKLCKSCSAIKNGESNIKFNVSKEELQQLVETMPFTSIGSKFGVSDNSIRKRCKKLGIVIPKREPGYWLKVKSNNS